MQNFVRLPAILFASIWLTGCLSQSELSGADDVPMIGGASVDADTDTLAHYQAVTPLGDDTLVAPLEPTLRIQAAAGALEFFWEDRHNDTHSAITAINLYQYNYRSELEVAVDATIEPTNTAYTHAVAAHQIAWDSTSYRVEICTHDNCLSSARMPIQGLLGNVADPITTDSSDLAISFGDQVALNSTGNIAVVTSPENASALVFFHVAKRWIQATTLSSNSFSKQTDSAMRIGVSASGDTIAVASIASNSSPVVVIFDRLGENWIETGSLVPITTNNATQNWYADTLSVALSDDGDRLAVAAHSEKQSVDTLLDNNTRVMIFDRGTVNWIRTTSLSVPAQHTRLPAFSNSAALDRIFVLSVLTDNLYLNEYTLGTSGWDEATPQLIDTISPSSDNIVVSSDTGSEIAIAGWEIESNAQFAAVAWRFQKSASSWIATDSVKLPPATLTAASLRLAADANLSSIAIGWQAPDSANLAFYAQNQEHWQHLFSAPEAFNLNRNLPLAQSVAISADNSTALIGTSNTGNGGVVSAFR